MPMLGTMPIALLAQGGIEANAALYPVTGSLVPQATNALFSSPDHSYSIGATTATSTTITSSSGPSNSNNTNISAATSSVSTITLRTNS
ncbi:hypothetical protein BGZ97_009771 [Linnemannia gamsii]|uniref:Uncharacterized protein n=1 Tax=Linnemannia gamsii TaxID=64522 RepID=A0A9P6R6V4_9FUNG|nr:hypothetical protein BGZ97_009771 [Linnemannia gamsii]